jgi:UDP-N-acetylglucosamine:LPS N-acetylglucosamine transferase
MRDALLLAGSVGLGHEMLARTCSDVLIEAGWRTRTLDCMAMLGRGRARVGQRLFDSFLAVPGIYDGLHFAHLRTGSRMAEFMDRAASARLMPALRDELERHPADLVLSVFATGASAAAKLKAEAPARRTVVLCTDAAVHRLWVSNGTDLFLVTSKAAAASVRRYQPRAAIETMPPPVRPQFYAAPSQQEARAALGIPPAAFCVLAIDSGWGFGPLAGSVSALADSGVHVLAVAGRRRSVERRLRALSAKSPLITPFGFTDQVPALMAAADLVLTLPGATTCSEARVVGRQLLLLDVMPGHGRDNVQHELELGAAHACVPSPRGVADCVLALRDQPQHVSSGLSRAPRWEPAFAAALQRIGLSLSTGANEKGEDRHAHALSEPSFLSGIRRRSRCQVPGQAGDPLVLVSHLARPARGSRPRQPARRRPASGPDRGRRGSAGSAARSGNLAHKLSDLPRRHPGSPRHEGRESGPAGWLRRGQGGG